MNPKKRAGWPAVSSSAIGGTGFTHHPALVRLVEADAVTLEFALHATEFRIGDRLDHAPEVTADAAQSAARVDANAFFSLDPAELVAIRRFAPGHEVRPVIIAVEQIAVFIVVGQIVRHLDRKS